MVQFGGKQLNRKSDCLKSSQWKITLKVILIGLGSGLCTLPRQDQRHFGGMSYLFEWRHKNELIPWWEPWSSGYGRRLMFQRLWVWNPALYTWWTFFSQLFVVKIVMCVWKHENCPCLRIWETLGTAGFFPAHILSAAQIWSGVRLSTMSSMILSRLLWIKFSHLSLMADGR